MTNEEHNKYIAWAFIAHGTFQTFMMLVMFLFFSLAFVLPGDPGGPPSEIFLLIFGFVFLFQMIFAVPSFVAAFGLLKRKSWARMAAIVAGILSAMNVPIGTAACVYSLWFFLGENWKDLYGSSRSFRPEADTRQLVHDRESRWTGYHTNEQGEVVFKAVDPPDWR